MAASIRRRAMYYLEMTAHRHAGMAITAVLGSLRLLAGVGLLGSAFHAYGI